MTTEQVQLFGSGNPDFLSYVNAGNLLYFDLGGIWRTDGTESGTIQLTTTASDSGDSLPRFSNTNARGAIGLDGQYIFSGTDRSNLDAPGIGGLYLNNGTPEGTTLLSDVSNPERLTNIDGTVYFTTFDGEDSGRILWRTDGTPEGTQFVADVNPNDSEDDDPFRDFAEEDVNGSFLFEAFDGETNGLWRTDGTTEGTQLIRSFDSVVPGQSLVNLEFFDVAGDNLFFRIDNSLWRSDGTEAGTQLITQLPTGTLVDLPSLFVGAGDNLFFPVSINGSTSLWRSDGTEAGTQLVSNNGVGDLIEVNETLYFTSNDGLLTSDGTTEGTRLVADVAQGRSITITGLTEANGNLFFVVTDRSEGIQQELWQSDGTEAGTTIVEEDFNPTSLLTASDEDLYFTSGTTFEGQNTNALFSVSVSNENNGGEVGEQPNNGSSDITGTTVYRFFNNNSGVHFYTANEAERDAVQGLDNFSFEGGSYVGVDPLTGQPEPLPVYRFLNQDTGVHLYTISETERDVVQGLDNFSFEGEAFFAYESEIEGSIPIYRFFNNTSGAHFYTPSAGERDNVEANLPDFQSEGIAYYALPLPE